jgi:hypothetical protein
MKSFRKLSELRCHFIETRILVFLIMLLSDCKQTRAGVVVETVFVEDGFRQHPENRPDCEPLQMRHNLRCIL